MTHVKQAITVERPRAELFRFWRQLENLPIFMRHLKVVAATGGTTSHWVARAPGGSEVEWDAEIIAARRDELISWRSIDGSIIKSQGTVRFRDARAGCATELSLELAYDAPPGTLGTTVAMLFGDEPPRQLTDDLRRFKQIMESGEVVLPNGTTRRLRSPSSKVASSSGRLRGDDS